MRYEKIYKKRRNMDSTPLLVMGGVALFTWSACVQFISPIVGNILLITFLIIGILFIKKNHLGENRYQSYIKKVRYYKKTQTYVYKK